jgi:hypothetical protein
VCRPQNDDFPLRHTECAYDHKDGQECPSYSELSVSCNERIIKLTSAPSPII